MSKIKIVDGKLAIDFSLSVGQLASMYLSHREAELLCDFVRARVRTATELTDHELLAKTIKTLDNFSESVLSRLRHLEAVAVDGPVGIGPSRSLEDRLDRLDRIERNLNPNELEWIAPLRTPSFKTRKYREKYGQFARVLDYCMAVARQIGTGRQTNKEDGSEIRCYQPDKWSDQDVWVTINSRSHSIFEFDTKGKCDFFIRCVGQERLDVVFGVKR